MTVSMYLVVSAAAAGVGFGLARLASLRRRREALAAAQAQVAAKLQSARIAAAAKRRATETEARAQALEERAAAERDLGDLAEDVARREERAHTALARLARESQRIDGQGAVLDARDEAAQAARERAQELRRQAAEGRSSARQALSERAGEAPEVLSERMIHGWLEDSRAQAAQRLRAIEGDVNNPRYDRTARRVMEIASSRYQNHFLTERNISNLRVGGEVCELLTEDGGSLHEILQEVANVQLHINPEADAVRLDGLDGVGREVARRALNRLAKRGAARAEAQRDARQFATRIRTNLEREITTLGKRAFQILAIQRPHAEIVDLVGALNYRTSYTQNQWLHAVEASFLAGMMASELGLDIKLARRATLMHDIGKALTHKIEGSHAVIGADIARRLGEDEIVANAIGAHHADEPPGSVYAHLVAAADAMSGARPGARRETTDLFSHRVEDLERIGLDYRGVERAHAVHGGRELRLYVNEADVTDVDVIDMSAEIADRIAEELTFPGQIKVTVIRSFEAAAVAN